MQTTNAPVPLGEMIILVTLKSAIAVTGRPHGVSTIVSPGQQPTTLCGLIITAQNNAAI
jgi:hypothetical protein